MELFFSVFFIFIFSADQSISFKVRKCCGGVPTLVSQKASFSGSHVHAARQPKECQDVAEIVDLDDSGYIDFQEQASGLRQTKFQSDFQLSWLAYELHLGESRLSSRMRYWSWKT